MSRSSNSDIAPFIRSTRRRAREAPHREGGLSPAPRVRFQTLPEWRNGGLPPAQRV